MLVVGVDENGLGPRLGPMVVTSVALETPRYQRAFLTKRGLDLGLTDSKQAGGFGRLEFTESVALGVLRVAGLGTPGSADEFLERVAPGTSERLRRRCPDHSSASQCWAVDFPLPGFGGDASFGEALLQRLVGRSRLRIADVQSRVVCAGVLNERLAIGQSKLAVDLELFEELIASALSRHGSPLLAVCGMIGGIRDYQSRFSRFEGRGVEELGRRRGERRYSIERLGEVRFEVDADARHLPVALASMVGKYLREICMRRIGEFYRRHDPALELSSGYHDPVTTRFIDATAPARRRLQIAPDCFRRQA